MITLGDTSYSLDDPLVLAALIAAGALLLILILLVMAVRSASRSARMADPILRQMGDLGQRVQGLSAGQHQLVVIEVADVEVDPSSTAGCQFLFDGVALQLCGSDRARSA